MNRHYRRQKPARYTDWQYASGPAPAALFLAVEDDRLLGSLGVQMRPLTTGDRCAFTIDLLVDESRRNRGLPILLEERVRAFAADHGAGLLATLPNQEGMRTYERLDGWRCIGVVRTLESAAPRDGVRPVNTRTSASIAFLKDARWRDWRFARNPEYAYEPVSSPEGSMVWTKVFADPVSGLRSGDIVDYEIKEPAAFSRLIAESCRQLRSQGVDKITLWMLPQDERYQALIEMGFAVGIQERFFCVKPLGPETKSYEQLANWDLVEADSEVY
jgi:GNAT superfamily N-acetyltransferase